MGIDQRFLFHPSLPAPLALPLGLVLGCAGGWAGVMLLELHLGALGAFGAGLRLGCQATQCQQDGRG